MVWIITHGQIEALAVKSDRNLEMKNMIEVEIEALVEKTNALVIKDWQWYEFVELSAMANKYIHQNTYLKTHTSWWKNISYIKVTINIQQRLQYVTS